MREKWRTYRSLPPASKHALLAALALLPMVRLSLRCLGLVRTRRLLAALPLPLFTMRHPTPDPADVALMTASAAAILPLECTCLPRALVTSRLLAEMGRPGELRLGTVRTGEQSIEAHAWVEHQGLILDPLPDETRRFKPFGRLPGHPNEAPFRRSA
jgi:Transglutaminase-like superfamily